MNFMKTLFAALLCAICATANAQNITLSNSKFSVVVNRSSGAITSFKLPGDVFPTDYIMSGRTIGDLNIRYKVGTGSWLQANTNTSSDNRVVTTPTASSAKISYSTNSTNSTGIKSFTLEETYDLQGDYLTWSIRFKNRGTQTIELGDIGLPLNYNTDYNSDAATVYTMRLMRHSFISADGSWIYLQRNDGTPPYLVMTPGQGTRLEYFIQRQDSDPWVAYIHAKYRATVVDTTGTWRQPITSRVLSAAGSPGDEYTYSFRFRWADSYDGVRQTLVNEGLVDVQSVPGMSVPQNTVTTVSLTSMQAINSVTPEFPSDTTVTFLGKQNKYTYIYQVTFNKIGENLLTVDFGNSRKLYLEYFCTQPTETLIKKRSSFIVAKQQHKDAGKWYNGLYSVWDMQNKVLRSPDNTGGLWNYIVGGSDDPTNCKAPYVALKNVSFPVQSEIDSCEYYAQHFLWGGLQRTDTETPYPYGIYGIDNWYVNRNSSYGFGTGGAGQEHLWRCYDYPTIFYFYYNMYKIAKYYPTMVHYLNKNGYLERAFGTAKAYFEVPYSIMFSDGGFWGGCYQLGLYHEQAIPDFIDDLVAEGRTADADYLRGEWEKKVKFFCYDDPYPYTSEYSFDSTGFETAHAAARYGLEHTMLPDQNLWQDKNTKQWYSHPSIQKEDFRNLMERETAANISDRGWIEPSYHQYGSDTRGFGNISYMLTYESQMAGNSVLDYALYYSENPEEYLRLGYASYLSSWSLINAGDSTTNYGYWFPGSENDGAAGWGFEPQKIGRPWIGVSQGRGSWTYDGEIDHGFMGGLRCARTIVANDPIFGSLIYGGTMTKSGDVTTIVPKDALRQRVHLLNVSPRLHLELSRDGFNSVQVTTMADGMVKKLVMSVENRTPGISHQTTLSALGLPTGYYMVTLNSTVSYVQVNSATLTNIPLAIPMAATNTVTIDFVTIISGTVKNASGALIPNAAVQLGGFGGPAMITGTDGAYTLHAPASGNQILYVDAPGYKPASMLIYCPPNAPRKQNVILTSDNETGGIVNGSFEQAGADPSKANGWQLISSITGTDIQGLPFPAPNTDMYLGSRDMTQNQTSGGSACGIIQVGNPITNPSAVSERIYGASGTTTALTATTATTTLVSWATNAWAGHDLVLEKTSPALKRVYKILSNTTNSVTIASGNMLTDGFATGCSYRIVKNNYQNYYQGSLCQSVEIDPDSKYNFYFKGDANGSSGAFWSLKWTDAQHNEIGKWTDISSDGPWLTSAGWNQYLRGKYQQGTIKMNGPMLNMTPPMGAKYLEVSYGFSDDTAANRNGTIRVDDVVIDRVAPAEISDLKNAANTTVVTLSSEKVTLAPRDASGARSTNYFYIEDADRISGIRVEDGAVAQDGVREGDTVTITGVMRTSAAGERYIELLYTPIYSADTQAKPLLVNTKSVQTDKLILGQLVKVAAEIVEHAADGKSLTIRDGYSASGAEVLTTVIIDGAPLSASEFIAGSTAEITGVVSLQGTSTTNAKRVILMKR